MTPLKGTASERLQAVLTGRFSCQESPSGLVRAVLAEVLEASDSAGGLLAVFEICSSFREPAAMAVLGHLPVSTQQVLAMWRRSPGKQGRLTSANQSVFFRPIWDGNQLAGVLALKRPFRKTALERTKELLNLFSAGVYRQLLRSRIASIHEDLDIVGSSPVFLRLERQIRCAATHPDAPVLVTGERGCGKELAALAVHLWSRRRAKPFVPLLASVLPETLIADELYGHERYAFTDARRSRRGHFAAAEDGTLFLDEVGDLPPNVQSSLLRVLENREVSRVGSDCPVRVNVRVVAATNKNLPKLVQSGQFRSDLLDRLRVFEVELPNLAQRCEDVPHLAAYFLRSQCVEARRRCLGSKFDHCSYCELVPAPGCASKGFFQALNDFSWPGNVRELRSFIIRTLAYHSCHVLGSQHVNLNGGAAHGCGDGWSLESILRRHLLMVLERTGGNQSQAARLLGIPLGTLRSKLEKLKIRQSA